MNACLAGLLAACANDPAPTAPPNADAPSPATLPSGRTAAGTTEDPQGETASGALGDRHAKIGFDAAYGVADLGRGDLLVAFSPSGRAAAAPRKSAGDDKVRVRLLTEDGRLDRDLAVVIPAGNRSAGGVEVKSLLVDDDGSVLVAGSIRTGREDLARAFVARLGADGKLDGGFGVDGVQRFYEHFASAPSIVRTVDGGYLVSVLLGYISADVPGGRRDFETHVYKLSSKGALDASFGNGEDGFAKIPAREVHLFPQAAGDATAVYSTDCDEGKFRCSALTTTRLTAAGALRSVKTVPTTAFDDWSVVPTKAGFLASLEPQQIAPRVAVQLSANGERIDAALLELGEGSKWALELPDGSLLETKASTLRRWTPAGSLDAAFGDAGTLSLGDPWPTVVSYTTTGAIMVAAYRAPDPARIGMEPPSWSVHRIAP